MHLSVEQLLEVRDGEASPDARAHAASCGLCASEIERMRALAAGLKSLPAFEPPPDQWEKVRGALEGRRRRISAGTGVGLAVAASLALIWLLPREAQPPRPAAIQFHETGRGDTRDVAQLMEESRRLEEMLRVAAPRQRVVSGWESSAATDLESEIALVDARLTGLGGAGPSSREAQRLWAKRVSLMNDLVRVRGARPAYVGF